MRKIRYAAIDYNSAMLRRCGLDIDWIEPGRPQAEAYNEYLEGASGLVCFVHGDTTHSGLDAAIRRTIAMHGFSGALGVVGPGGWAERGRDIIQPTCDGCLIVVDSDRAERFDAETFGGYHLYAEDYCMQVGGCRMIDLDGYEWGPRLRVKGDHFIHHSQTMHERGGAWGDYRKYKERLNLKWGRCVPTT